MSSQSSEFVRRFLAIQADLHAAAGVRVCFKVAAPLWDTSLPPQAGQHRSAYCMAVKRDTERIQACMLSDNLSADRHPSREPYVRTCPFGVTEVVAPLWLAGRYQGCLFVGAWRSSMATGFDPRYGSLPRFCPKKARAAANLARESVLAILPLHDAAAGSAARGDETIQRAIHYMQQNLRATLRADEVAKAVHLSRSRFIHRFNAAAGMGFGEYVRRQVMRQAVSLLIHRNMRVIDCALELGYTNQNHFATVFRRSFGCTPSAFRTRSTTQEP